MKIAAYQDIQRHRECIGNNENKKHHYRHQNITQQKINHLADTQRNTTPQRVCPLTLLYATSIIACLSRGENTLSAIAQEKKQHGMPALPHLTKKNLSFASEMHKRWSDVVTYYDPLKFPGAYAMPSHVRPAVSWFRPHISAFIPHKPMFTKSLDSEEVKIEKIDFSCITERSALSISDVLRKIADTLQHPITEMARETQVLTYYAHHRPCPTQKEVEKVTAITDDIDRIISQVINTFPQFTETQLIQQIIAPTIRIIADDIEDKKIDDADIDDINDNILSFSKSIISSAIHDQNIFITGGDLQLPENITVKKGIFYIKIDDDLWSLTHDDRHFFATKNGVTHQVKYYEEDHVWRFHDTEIKTTYQQNEDPFFTPCPLKTKRGNDLGKLCSSLAEISADNIQQQPHVATAQDTDGTENAYAPLSYHSPRHNQLIESMDIGLKETSERVNKIQLSNTWIIYRIRENDNLPSKYFHAIKLNNKLIPVRATSIYNYHVHCEVYDLKQSQLGHPVVFHEGNWWFERSTSIHVAQNLKENIPPSMFVKDIDIRALSTPDTHGFKWDSDGNAYLKINNRFAKVANPLNAPVIEADNGDSFYLTVTNGKYHLAKASLKNGHLTVTPEQFEMDKQLNSANGLNFQSTNKLNNNWSLLNVNVKSNRIIESRMLGSKIDVKFKLLYQNIDAYEFVELPALQWKERIRYKEGNTLWQFSSEMYDHNRNSRTFFPWNNKYIEAYHFAKAEDKNTYHTLVALYDQNMQTLPLNGLPESVTNEEKIHAVKTYLKRYGGILEVTITDIPQIRVENIDISKERIIYFDIGFNDQSAVRFNQGISLSANEFEHIFVTTSDEINLAEGEVNAFAPSIVARKRQIKRRK